jgi:hypothetical protein
MTELVWEQRRDLLRNTPPFSDEAPDLEYAGCVYQWQPVTEISGG